MAPGTDRPGGAGPPTSNQNVQGNQGPDTEEARRFRRRMAQAEPVDAPPTQRRRGGIQLGGEGPSAQLPQPDAQRREMPGRRMALGLGDQDQAEIFRHANANLDRLTATRVGRAAAPEGGTSARAPGEQRATEDLLASVSDGRVGSVYLDQGRIRTTHFAGPAREHSPTDRFNVDSTASWSAFLAERPDVTTWAEVFVDQTLPEDQREAAVANHIMDQRDHWMAATLQNAMTIGAELPDWAMLVTDATSVEPAPDTNQPTGQVLLEVYHGDADNPPRLHTSRGVAARVTMPQGTMQVLHEAIASVQDIANPVQRNEQFYNYVGSHAPEFAEAIRRPQADGSLESE